MYRRCSKIEFSMHDQFHLSLITKIMYITLPLLYSILKITKNSNTFRAKYKTISRPILKK